MELSEIPVDNTLDPQKAPISGTTPDEQNAPAETIAATEAQPTVLPETESTTPDTPSDSEAAPAESASDAETRQPMTEEEIVEVLTLLADKAADEIGNDELAKLKQQFYQLHNEEIRRKKAAFVEAGGEEADFHPEADPLEEKLKAQLNIIKEKKSALRALQEAERQLNYEKKHALVEELRTMADDTDNVNRHAPRAREIQNEFKQIGEVDPAKSGEIWKEYQEAIERFYDQWKVNKELRDYDFKKNLADKEAILEKAAALGEEKDVVAAFRRLQELHNEWREIGPVAKEVREEIWARFKEYSATVNKRYQTHFEERKNRELENENAKTAICEQLEAISVQEATTYAAWDELTRKIIALQEDWRKLGYASRKTNSALFVRFRAACDAFFARKGEFFRKMKEELSENLVRKTALCERAEALKDSTDWRKATDEFVALQKEWKEIGGVPKRQSDFIWKRFQRACDYFFQQKKEAASGQHKEEHDNLAAKQAIIEELTALSAPGTETPRGELIARLKDIRARWQAIGHVPYKEKDRIQETYHKLSNQLSRRLDQRDSRARMASFEVTVSEADGGRLNRERERLARALDNRKAELQTYGNNMGFLTSKTKSGESILREMERKMQHLRDEIAELEEKIRMIDRKM